MTWGRGAPGRWILSTGCADNYRSIREITWPNLESYAQRHGMNFWGSYWPLDKSIYGGNDCVPHTPSWFRLLDIKRAFAAGASAVFCIDTDAIILQPDRWIGDETLAHSVWMAWEDWQGHVFPSNGVSVIKNDPVGDAWVDALLRAYDRLYQHPWAEQAAAYELLGMSIATEFMSPSPSRPVCAPSGWGGLVGALPQSWSATPKQSVADPIVYHATGIPYDERVAELSFLMAGGL